MYVDLKCGINIGQCFVTPNKPTKLSVGMVTLTITGLLARYTWQAILAFIEQGIT